MRAVSDSLAAKWTSGHCDSGRHADYLGPEVHRFPTLVCRGTYGNLKHPVTCSCRCHWIKR